MIQFENVTYCHPGTGSEIGPISFVCNLGERLLVAGLNGSGKSTLLRLAAGIIKPSSGRILIDSIATDDEPGMLRKRAQIGYISQNPESQLLTNSVDLELAFALENMGIDRTEMKARVDEASVSFGFAQELGRHPSTLSAGEIQRLALACTLITKPSVVVMDEPSSYLDSSGKKLLDRHIFGDRSKSILAASHDLSELNAYDRILFLEDGRQQFLGSPEDFQKTATWNVIVTTLNRPKVGSPAIAGSTPPDAVRVADLSFAYDNHNLVISELNADIPTCRVTGIVGASGSGKTTLALLIAGVLKPNAGDIKFCSDPSRGEGSQQVGYVFQIPESAIFAETVYEEIAYGLRNNGVSESELRQLVESALSQVGLDPAKFLERHPMLLSSGEQRLVSIAAIVALDHPTMILDEPTADLDWLGELRVQELITGQRELGKTVIVISHSEKFLDSVADRIIEIHSGQAILRD